MSMQFLNGRIQRPFKSESGASGPKSVARGTKSITFAYVFFSYGAVWGGLQMFLCSFAGIGA